MSPGSMSANFDGGGGATGEPSDKLVAAAELTERSRPCISYHDSLPNGGRVNEPRPRCSRCYATTMQWRFRGSRSIHVALRRHLVIQSASQSLICQPVKHSSPARHAFRLPCPCPLDTESRSATEGRITPPASGSMRRSASVRQHVFIQKSARTLT